MPWGKQTVNLRAPTSDADKLQQPNLGRKGPQVILGSSSTGSIMAHENMMRILLSAAWLNLQMGEEISVLKLGVVMIPVVELRTHTMTLEDLCVQLVDFLALMILADRHFSSVYFSLNSSTSFGELLSMSTRMACAALSSAFEDFPPGSAKNKKHASAVDRAQK